MVAATARAAVAAAGTCGGGDGSRQERSSNEKLLEFLLEAKAYDGRMRVSSVRLTHSYEGERRQQKEQTFTIGRLYASFKKCTVGRVLGSSLE